MPYVLVISTPYSVEKGPTTIGEGHAEPNLMEYLGAKKDRLYAIPDSPTIVLDKLERRGYKVVTTCGNTERFVWTMHKP